MYREGPADKNLDQKGLVMYSKKQREEAIKLYIKFRFKATKVCNYLGYPDRSVLKK